MKHYYFILLAICVLVISCSTNSEEEEPTYLNIEESLYPLCNDTIYVNEENVFSIFPENENCKKYIRSVEYYFNGIYMGMSSKYPFKINFTYTTLFDPYFCADCDAKISIIPVFINEYIIWEPKEINVKILYR